MPERTGVANILALYLIGVIALTAIGVAGLVTLELVRPDGANNAIVSQIIGLIGPSIIGLMVLIRSVANGQAAEAAATLAGEAKVAAASTHREIQSNNVMTAETAATVKNIAVANGVPAATPAAVQDVLSKSLPMPP